MSDILSHFDRIIGQSKSIDELWDTQKFRNEFLISYHDDRTSFLPILTPVRAIKLTVSESVEIIRTKLGRAFDIAVSEKYCSNHLYSIDFPREIISPVVNEANGSWLKQVNMVGINVRTIHSFWNIAKYLLTLPKTVNSIHILPIWEPGVVDSLYGISSWRINDEFFDKELKDYFPHLDTAERQLKCVINIIHAFGKSVGMDVIPHTDRFSEVVLCNPEHFEWLIRKDKTIVNHENDLHSDVQKKIFQFLVNEGTGNNNIRIPESAKELFSDSYTEEERCKLLFGNPEEREIRTVKRIKLVKYLHEWGIETVPATMGPPYRGLEVDTRDEAFKVDENGLSWRDYKIINPQSMSRVFGPLTRYKLYENKNNNVDWEIDFSKPRKNTWEYVCKVYAEFQKIFNFDFMRGDMSHVQMRPEGVPSVTDDFYDILKSVKRYTTEKNKVYYYGYFAESFLAPPNIMAYGDEVDHLNASEADIALGDLQSGPINTNEFLDLFSRYLDITNSKKLTPSFTIITADKDDPRFDKFYLTGNETRYFIGQFLNDLPSYWSLGFERRDIHHLPAPNEHYTKLYVFQEKNGPKATNGPYIWGRNNDLFKSITRIKICSEEILPLIKDSRATWLINSQDQIDNKILIWSYALESKKLIFISNLESREKEVKLYLFNSRYIHNAKFSTIFNRRIDRQILSENNFFTLLPNESLIFDGFRK